MIVTQTEIIRAMAYWEKSHIAQNGPLDGVTLPRECSKLADLLGRMWFEREDETQVPDESETANLIAATRC